MHPRSQGEFSETNDVNWALVLVDRSKASFHGQLFGRSPLEALRLGKQPKSRRSACCYREILADFLRNNDLSCNSPKSSGTDSPVPKLARVLRIWSGKRVSMAACRARTTRFGKIHLGKSPRKRSVQRHRFRDPPSTRSLRSRHSDGSVSSAGTQ